MLSGSRPSAVSLYTRDPLKLSTKPRMIGCLDPLVPIVVKSSRYGYYCPLNLYEYVSLKKTLALVMSFLSLSSAAALERFARVLTRLWWLERRRMPA